MRKRPASRCIHHGRFHTCPVNIGSFFLYDRHRWSVKYGWSAAAAVAGPLRITITLRLSANASTTAMNQTSSHQLHRNLQLTIIGVLWRPIAIATGCCINQEVARVWLGVVAWLWLSSVKGYSRCCARQMKLPSSWYRSHLFVLYNSQMPTSLNFHP